MQPVRELDDHDADVRCDGKEQFPEVFHLFLLFRDVIGFCGLRQFRDAVDEHGYIVTEFPFDIFQRYIFTVLHGIVKKRGNNALRVHSEVQYDLGDLKRMRDIRLPGFAELSVMMRDRKVDRFLKQFRLLR